MQFRTQGMCLRLLLPVSSWAYNYSTHSINPLWSWQHVNDHTKDICQIFLPYTCLSHALNTRSCHTLLSHDLAHTSNGYIFYPHACLTHRDAIHTFSVFNNKIPTIYNYSLVKYLLEIAFQFYSSETNLRSSLDKLQSTFINFNSQLILQRK